MYLFIKILKSTPKMKVSRLKWLDIQVVITNTDDYHLHTNKYKFVNN